MGSKARPLSTLVQDAPDHDIGGRPAASSELRHRKLLGRIADALQVPQAALYRPPNAVTPAQGIDGDGAIDLDGECAALLRAFRRIRDDDDRRRLLALVQVAAERA